MISRETIEAVKNKAGIVDVVADTIPVKRSGGRSVALCPFHNEKSPSFFLREEDNTYHCFGCGASGNVISYVMKLKGLTFPEAIEELAVRFSIPIIRDTLNRPQPAESSVQKVKLIEILKLSQEYFKAHLSSNASSESKAALNYALNRGLSQEMLNEFGVGYAPKTKSGLVKLLIARGFSEAQILASGIAKKSPRGETLDLYWGRLMFPIFTDLKKIVAFGGRIIPDLFKGEDISHYPKYINSPETQLYLKSKTLYGLALTNRYIREEKSVYVVEGYLDLIGLYQNGIKNVVATCGTALTQQHVEMLSKIVKNITVLFDGDNAGKTAAARSFKLFMSSPIDVKAAFLPDGEDPDTFSRKYGQETAGKLQDVDRKPLFDVFLKSLARDFGAANLSELGPASKSSLIKELLKTISHIKDRVLLTEYIKRAGFLLMVDEKLILDANTAAKDQLPSSSAVTMNDSDSKIPGQDDEQVVKDAVKFHAVDKLSKTEKELLSCVMVLREEVLSELLSNDQVMTILNPDLIVFFDRFAAIFKNAFQSNHNEDALKKNIKDLLSSFGKSWLLHWKSAYEFYSRKGTNPKKSYDELLASLQKDQKLKLIKQLECEISTEPDQDKKAELAKSLIELRRAAIKALSA